MTPTPNDGLSDAVKEAALLEADKCAEENQSLEIQSPEIYRICQAAILAHDAEREKEVCSWSRSKDPAYWVTGCNNNQPWYPGGGQHNFCPDCGKRIAVAEKEGA